MVGRQVLERVGPGARDVGFRAPEEGGADLHGAGAEHERRRRGAPVADCAGSDDRKVDPVGKMREDGHQARARMPGADGDRRLRG